MSQAAGSNNSALATTLLWPPTTQPPNDEPSVWLAFHGLFCFAYNAQTGACEVGAHRKAPDHDFGIYVLEVDTDTSDLRLVYSFTPEAHEDVPDGSIVLDIEQPATPGVTFFQAASADEKNWSQLPDFEGPKFYNTPLRKKPNALRPRLNIKHGLFYVCPTPEEFSRINEDDAHTNPVDLGQIAFLILANLTHAQGGYVSMKIGQEELRLQASDTKKYIIFFTNVCPPDECKHDPDSPIKERRNDFFLYYKTFKRPDGSKEYGLKIKRTGAGVRRTVAPVAFLNFIGLDLLGQFVLLSDQDAPCGSSGFGQSSGLGN